LAALGLGAVHTTVAILQQSMNEDGIGYLDMGDAFLRGDWDMAINGVWSPLYAAILGIVNAVFEPTIHWAFPTAQLANFGIYVVALFCFEFFWREMTSQRSRTTGESWMTFHPAGWLILGYSLFIWSSLNLIEMWAVTPDMTVAAVVYVAGGLFLRLTGPDATARTPLALGAVLGVGYYAKAAMMPLGVLLLLLTLLVPAPRSKRFFRFGAAAAAFLVVAAPLLIVLSIEHGKPTFGDVGRFTYLKHVNELRYPDFLADAERLPGDPLHPPRRIFDEPPIYEFAAPVGGTYPMAYDPGYWTAGLSPSVTVPQQLRALATNVMVYFDLFVRQQGVFLAVALFLIVMALRSGAPVRPARAEVALMIWGLAALGMYSLVYVATRYVAPFLLLFWAAWLSLIRLPSAPPYRQLLNTGVVLLIAAVWINIGALNIAGLAGVAGFQPLSETSHQAGQFSDGHDSAHGAIAEELIALGLESGDQVGHVGYSFSAYWARLAGLQIIAEIHPEDIPAFQAADNHRLQEILAAFASTGARAVIVAPLPNPAVTDDWESIGDTGYRLYRLR
jgi:hypothetical protein